MKPYLCLVAMFCVASTSPEERRQTEIMDAIESDIRLPSDASPLTKFARTYKFASASRVLAFYFIPSSRHDKRLCQMAKKVGSTNGPIILVCPPPDGLTAGERRWLSDDVSLPNVFDGGCNYINVEYDLKSKAMTSTRCHGGA